MSKLCRQTNWMVWLKTDFSPTKHCSILAQKFKKKVPARSARFLKAFPFCAQTKIFLTVRFLLVFSIAVFPFLQQYTMHAKVKKKHTISLKRQRFCVKTRFEERKCIEK